MKRKATERERERERERRERREREEWRKMGRRTCLTEEYMKQKNVRKP